MPQVHSYCDVFGTIRRFLVVREFAPEEVRPGVADGHAILADIDRIEGMSLEAQETYLRQFILALEAGSYFTGEPLIDQSFNPWKVATTESVLRDFPDLLVAVADARPGMGPVVKMG